MAPRLSGQTSIFGVVYFVFKSLLGIERQKKLRKFTIFFLTGHRSTFSIAISYSVLSVFFSPAELFIAL